LRGDLRVGLDLSRSHSSTAAGTETVAGVAYPFPASTNNVNDFAIRVRTAIVPAFRLQAAAGRTTGGAGANYTNYSVDAEYELNKSFSLDAGYALSTSTVGDARGLGLSGRYYF